MKLEELKEDYDWQEAFCYAQFNLSDVVEIIATDEGQNDGDTWIGVFELQGGRFGYVEAWCDYTGWDCQAGGSSDTFDTLEKLKRFGLTTDSRRRLGWEIPELDHLTPE